MFQLLCLNFLHKRTRENRILKKRRFLSQLFFFSHRVEGNQQHVIGGPGCYEQNAMTPLTSFFLFIDRNYIVVDDWFTGRLST